MHINASACPVVFKRSRTHAIPYFAQVVRADESLSSLPVILLSARSNEAHKVLALERGADDYITKPFSSKELYARVKVSKC